MKEFKITMFVAAFLIMTTGSFAQEVSNAVIEDTADAIESAEINEANSVVDAAMDVNDDANQIMDESNLMADESAMNMLGETNEVLEDELAFDIPQALAIIEGTEDDSELYGEVELTQTDEGVMVNAEIYNAVPGKHGFHIHENGSCAEKGEAAGGHFNPDNLQHGNVTQDGIAKAHAGDMGNVEINEEGEGTISVLLPGTSLTEGNYNVSGKAIVLHEKADDFGQPTGNAGARIGCGVIELITEE